MPAAILAWVVCLVTVALLMVAIRLTAPRPQLSHRLYSFQRRIMTVIDGGIVRIGRVPFAVLLTATGTAVVVGFSFVLGVAMHA